MESPLLLTLSDGSALTVPRDGRLSDEELKKLAEVCKLMGVCSQKFYDALQSIASAINTSKLSAQDFQRMYENLQTSQKSIFSDSTNPHFGLLSRRAKLPRSSIVSSISNLSTQCNRRLQSKLGRRVPRSGYRKEDFGQQGKRGER